MPKFNFSTQNYWLNIDKPSGLVVHPGTGNYNGTLVNALLYHFKNLSSINSDRPGIVHRLDKETSGVMIIAKNDYSHQILAKQFYNREVQKTYKALVWGEIKSNGKIQGLIARDKKNRQAFSMGSIYGKESFTEYYRTAYLPPFTWLKLKPKTGRTHQLRVHLKSLDHPIVNDLLYGGGKERVKRFHVKYIPLANRILKLVNRVALHAEMLEITHPETREKMILKAKIPSDLQSALEALKNA